MTGFFYYKKKYRNTLYSGTLFTENNFTFHKSYNDPSAPSENNGFYFYITVFSVKKQLSVTNGNPLILLYHKDT